MIRDDVLANGGGAVEEDEEDDDEQETRARATAGRVRPTSGSTSGSTDDEDDDSDPRPTSGGSIRANYTDDDEEEDDDAVDTETEARNTAGHVRPSTQSTGDSDDDSGGVWDDWDRGDTGGGEETGGVVDDEEDEEEQDADGGGVWGDLIEDAGLDETDLTTADGLVDGLIGGGEDGETGPNVQANVQAILGAATGAEDEDELAEQIEDADDGLTEFLDNAIEGTAADNEATDTARSAGDMLFGEPARSFSKVFADVDPETGETDADVSGWDIADVGLTVGTAGAGGFLARGAARGGDEATGILSRLGRDGDDAPDLLRRWGDDADDAGRSLPFGGGSPGTATTAGTAGTAGIVGGGAMVASSGDESDESDDDSDDDTDADADDGDDGRGTDGSGTTPPFWTTGDDESDGDDGDDGDDEESTEEWGDLENVDELDGGWLLARQMLVDGDRSRYFVLGGPTGSAYLNPGGSTVTPDENENLRDMPSYDTEDDAREAHAAWVEENSRSDAGEDDEDRTWTEWRELQQAGPWHVYSRSHVDDEERIEFKAAGRDPDGDLVYLAPGGDVVYEEHIFDDVDDLSEALEAYAANEDDVDEERRPTGDRPSNEQIRSGDESDEEGDGDDEDGGIIEMVASNPLLAAGVVGGAALGVSQMGGDA